MATVPQIQLAPPPFALRAALATPVFWLPARVYHAPRHSLTLRFMRQSSMANIGMRSGFIRRRAYPQLEEYERNEQDLEEQRTSALATLPVRAHASGTRMHSPAAFVTHPPAVPLTLNGRSLTHVPTLFRATNACPLQVNLKGMWRPHVEPVLANTEGCLLVT